METLGYIAFIQMKKFSSFHIYCGIWCASNSIYKCRLRFVCIFQDVIYIINKVIWKTNIIIIFEKVSKNHLTSGFSHSSFHKSFSFLINSINRVKPILLNHFIVNLSYSRFSSLISEIKINNSNNCRIYESYELGSLKNWYISDRIKSFRWEQLILSCHIIYTKYV